MADLIDRQAVLKICRRYWHPTFNPIMEEVEKLPPAQTEPHYCRECKWSRCHVNVDKHGKSETYWRCLNWDGGTDEEGYCHEWEMKPG